MLKIKKIGHKPISPFAILLLSFLGLIAFGTVLLLLPISLKDGNTISFVDSLFISTSAVCVTGLVSTSIPISDLFSPFGHVVLMFLMEVGGLGFVTIFMFFFSMLGKKIGISTSVLLKEALNQNSYADMLPLVKKIVLTSFSIQLFGAVLNFIAFLQLGFDPSYALPLSLFHACSSFNNAGFDIFGASSLSLYKSNFLLMFSTSLLIIFGGIGFVCIFDILQKRSLKKLSLHTKIVLKTTFFILVFGSIFTKLTSWDTLSWSDAILTTVFARTAGFYTVDMPLLRNATIIILMFIMFIGGSPSSCAGGIKTTSLYTMIKAISSFALGNKRTHAYHREISNSSIFKAFVLTVVALAFVLIMTTIICVLEPEFTMLEILFESVSAFATVGTSLGITPHLQWGSKLLLCVLMYFGRLGPITFISLLNRRAFSTSDDPVRYVEEKIIIG